MFAKLFIEPMEVVFVVCLFGGGAMLKLEYGDVLDGGGAMLKDDWVTGFGLGGWPNGIDDIWVWDGDVQGLDARLDVVCVVDVQGFEDMEDEAALDVDQFEEFVEDQLIGPEVGLDEFAVVGERTDGWRGFVCGCNALNPPIVLFEVVVEWRFIAFGAKLETVGEGVDHEKVGAGLWLCDWDWEVIDSCIVDELVPHVSNESWRGLAWA
jgi:hypothetical protein